MIRARRVSGWRPRRWTATLPTAWPDSPAWVARRSSPAARALVACARNCSARERNCSIRAAVSGSVRRHCESSARLTRSSTARSRESNSRIRSRGTLPAASHRSWMDRRAARAASMPLPGSMRSASASNFSLAAAFASNSASRWLNVALRREKNFSWAARKRSQSWSSTSRGARPEAFHSSMSWRNSPAVLPHSPDSDSASARAISFSLASRAAPRCLSRSAK